VIDTRINTGITIIFRDWKNRYVKEQLATAVRGASLQKRLYEFAVAIATCRQLETTNINWLRKISRM